MMNQHNFSRFVGAASYVVLGCITALHAAPNPKKPLWNPVKDGIYLQEVGRKIQTDKPVLCVAACRSKLYAGFHDGLRILDGNRLVNTDGPDGTINRLESINGDLWALADSGLHRRKQETWTRIAPPPVNDICLHKDDIYVAAGKRLARVQGDSLTPVDGGTAPADVRRLASYSETLYCLGAGRLALFTGKRFDAINVTDWGRLPSNRTRDLFAQGSRLYIATDRGLGRMALPSRSPVLRGGYAFPSSCRSCCRESCISG